MAEDKIKPKMSQSLRKAYELARERPDLDFFKGLLREHEEFERSQREEAELAAAEKEEKAAAAAIKKAEAAKAKDKKEKRKSIAKSKDTVSGDDMDVDEKPASKKRKKAADSDGEEAKVSKLWGPNVF